MKQHNSVWHKAAFFSLVFALIFASCENLVNPPDAVPSVQAGTASVSFALADSTGRTVLPDLSEVNASELSYTLKGKKGETEQELASFSGNGTTLALESGEWTFTLNALKGEDIVLSATADAILAADQSNEVIFTLKPLKDGYGAINVSFTYPVQTGINRVRVESTHPALDMPDVPLPVGTGTWTYDNFNIKAGNYFTRFYFYRGDEPAVIVSETIQVRNGLTSKKTINLLINDLKPSEDLDPPALTSGWNDGYVEAGGEQWFKFTASYAADQFIHVKFGGLTNLYMTVYDSAWQPLFLYANPNIIQDGPKTQTALTDEQLTDGETYYIRVWPNYGYSGDYKIAVSDYLFWLEGPSSIPQLEEGWNEGNVEAGGEQWFKFTPSDAVDHQFIHVKFGGLTDLNVEVVDIKGLLYGGGYLFGSADTTAYTALSDELTAGQTYYIMVEPFGSGDYEIAISDSIWPEGKPLMPSLANGWNNGNIEAGGEQWFEFTPSDDAADHQFIHVKFGGLTNLNVEVLDSAWQHVGAGVLSGDVGTTAFMNLYGLSAEETYYIMVESNDPVPLSGDYDIAVNETPFSPDITPNEIADGWNDGNIAAGGEQWFKFTASDAEGQFIHVKFGGLTNLNVEVFDSTWGTVGPSANLSGSAGTTTHTGFFGILTDGQTYYIRVEPNDGGSGGYEIAVNETPISPDITPPELADDWIQGNIAEPGDEEWFTFTTNDDATKFLHVKFGGLTNLNVEVLDSAWQPVNSTSLYASMPYMNLYGLSAWETYYVRVWPINSSDSGDYEIAVNETLTAPGIALTEIGEDWTDGNIAVGGEQWFKFTASAESQYIHGGTGRYDMLSVLVYDSAGQTVYGNLLNFQYPYRNLSGLSAGGTYYIKVWDSSGSFTYKIAVNETILPPDAEPADMGTGWNNVSIGVGEEKWFSFTASEVNQYIHVIFDYKPVTLVVEVYDSAGQEVELEIVDDDEYTDMGSDLTGKRKLPGLTIGQTYYIRVWFYNNYITDFKIALNASTTPPASP